MTVEGELEEHDWVMVALLVPIFWPLVLGNTNPSLGAAKQSLSVGLLCVGGLGLVARQ